jgi:hypothetical protein
MPAGLGAGGAIGVALETAAAPGTWVTPAIWVPVLNENINYTEARYFSEAIRQQTIDQAAKRGYYHVEGTLGLELDTRTLPYFLHASRMGVVKTGAATPWTYNYSPASGATIPATNRTLSITLLRNQTWFAYTGCVVTNFDITINNGILEFNPTIMGTTDVAAGVITPTPTPAWTPAQILGAEAHSIAVGDGALLSPVAGVTAMASATVDQTFNGFTFTSNDNGAAQNRINQSRGAAYISFGKTEASVTTQLDFANRTDYDHFENADSKRLQFISSNGASDKVVINIYNSVFESYGVHLGAMADLVMADSVFHVLASGGANPGFDMNVVSTTSLIVS